MRNSNPALSEGTFERFAQEGVFGGQAVRAREGVMTIEGTVNKTLLLLFLAVLSASWTWSMLLNPATADTVWPIAMVGVVVAFFVGLATCFKPAWARFTAPAYALLEGLGLGAISSMVNLRYPGIAGQAVGLTFGVMAVLLLAYRSRLVQVNDKFRLGVVAATGGIALFYGVVWLLSWFHVGPTALVFGYFNTSPLAIGISIVVVIVAALNLLLDFDFIERGARAGAPKFMEWYGAFGLMVTLVWLYLEILRLLSRLNSRR